ncbi:MAG: serine/threonine-protein phosphatase [Actinomycetota bacterium]|nr:serine/threonine-protein phosphatase [Actinomycetota bacterium]
MESLFAERERAAFLAGASRALSGSLNLNRTVVRALHLLVPRFSRCAAVLLAGPRSATWTSLTVGPDDVPELRHGSGELPGASAAALRVGQQIANAPGPLDAVLPPGAGGRCEEPASATTLPLTARGCGFGTLVVAGGAAVPADDSEAALLEDLGRRVAAALDAAALYGERSHVAEVRQASLRPPQLPAVPGVRLAARYRSATEHTEIGGDFYDVHGEGEDWTVVVGDVCGKGVEAAVLTGQCRQAVRTAALVDRDPAAVLTLLNRVLAGREEQAGSFVTVSCARLRPGPRGGTSVDLASAGHPAPLVVRADGRIQEPTMSGLLAGAFPEADYASTTVALEPGDACVFYTDGVTEARGRDGEFGTEGLAAVLAACAGSDPAALVDVVVQAVLEHLDGSSRDDIAVLAVRAEAPAR